MKKFNKILLGLLSFFIILGFVFLISSNADASILDQVKDLINKNLGKPTFSLDSNISLAPGGDVEKNGQIDSGDIVRFSYTVINPTSKEYSFLTLKTNINRQQLNYIHNVQGSSGLNDNGKTITIPNISIGPSGSLIITFDARINYFSDKDRLISTEPELVSQDQKTLLKSGKKQISGKKIDSEKIESMSEFNARKR